jgi:ribosomal-protein-alanine N-acetyltransferase
MTPEDIPAVMALAEALPAAPHWPRSVYETALDPGGRQGRIVLLAHASGGSLAGFAAAAWTGPEAELESIAVAPAWQRQGVARSLFRRMAGLLSERGADAVFLEVRASNQPALDLYRSLGFAVTGRRRGYYADAPEDAIVMRLDLRSAGPEDPSKA